MDDLQTIPSPTGQPENKFAILVDSLVNIATAIIIFSIIYFFAAQPHQVDGSSMLPNFINGDHVLTEKLTQHWSGYSRGDVIVFHYPNNPKRDYIKRVIGLPGEDISLNGGIVYINDTPLSEDYIRANYTSGQRFLKDGETYHVKDDELFVMGDNRSESSDSRDWGTVPISLVVGKVFFRYWPPERVSAIHMPN